MEEDCIQLQNMLNEITLASNTFSIMRDLLNNFKKGENKWKLRKATEHLK